MNDGYHGIALIMNNVEWQQDKNGRPLMSTRDGARQDADDLSISLHAIGYKVLLKENLTGEDMKRKLKGVRDECINKGDDSFICCILSHGGSYGIFGIDKKCVPIDKFSEILEPDVCPKLMHKPKIFFIQACRGNEASEPIHAQKIDNGLEPDELNPRVPRGADFYLSYATGPGYVALRSHYPKLLSQALLEDSAQLSLDEIVTEIHDRLAEQVYDVMLKRERKEHLQIGQVVHSMRRAVYFK